MAFTAIHRPDASDRRMRLRPGVLTVALLVAAALPSTGASAGRAVTCTYDSSTRTIDVVSVSRSASFGVHVDGTEIHLNSSHEQCGPDAALFMVDTIRITDTPGSDSWVSISIDDPFAPGAEDEFGLSDEIEFVVDVGDGEDKVEFSNRSVTSAHVAAGLREIDGRERPVANLNADELDGVDYDAVLRGADSVEMWGSVEDDVLDATGGSDTGSMLDRPTYLVGSDGSDTVLGGSVNDIIYGEGAGFCQPDCSDFIEGGPGADEITGNFGPDEIRGGEGRDHLVGGYADDLFKGGPGRDDVNGNPGEDSLYGNRGPDDLDGGDDADECFGGPGDDSENNCE